MWHSSDSSYHVNILDWTIWEYPEKDMPLNLPLICITMLLLSINYKTVIVRLGIFPETGTPPTTAVKDTGITGSAYIKKQPSLLPWRQISHIFELCVENDTSLFSQFIFVHQFLEKRKFDGFSCMAPKFITATSTASGWGQGQTLAPEN